MSPYLGLNGMNLAKQLVISPHWAANAAAVWGLALRFSAQGRECGSGFWLALRFFAQGREWGCRWRVRAKHPPRSEQKRTSRMPCHPSADIEPNFAKSATRSFSRTTNDYIAGAGWSVRHRRQQTALVGMSDIRELGTILSIWAHPDDEAYLCGGIMAMAAAAKSRVVCVTATRGELGVTDPTRWPPEQLAVIREAELAECLRILGVTEHRWLGYPDGGCASVDPDAAAQQIAGIIGEIRPDTILTFAADGRTGHPDHIAVHRWTVEAVRRSGIGTLHVAANTQDWLDDYLAQLIELDVIVGEPPVAWNGPLSIDVALTGELLDRKYAALAAQTSQTHALRGLLGEERYREILRIEQFAAVGFDRASVEADGGRREGLVTRE
jgi:LmbE family N-acetylglucosaminyl deacetylase